MKRIQTKDIEVKIEDVSGQSKYNWRVTVKHPKVHTSYQTFCNGLHTAKAWAKRDVLDMEDLIESLA